MKVVLKAKEAEALGMPKKETTFEVPMKMTADKEGISALGGRVVYPAPGIRMGGVWMKQGNESSGNDSREL